MENIGNILNKKKWRPPKEYEFEGIRPPKKKTRLYLDNEYFKSGYGAAFPHSVTSVYGVLAMFANHKRQTCYPAAETIMDMCGMKNRTTVFRALKILEIYNIVQIISGSKGRVPNIYGLTDPSYWKSLNSINFETVIKSLKMKKTVSNTELQQSQKEDLNSGTSDTRIHRIESNKEITPENKEKEEQKTINGSEKLQRLSPLTKSAVLHHFSEEDVIAALEELPTLPVLKELLRALRKRGATPVTPLPNWLL